MLIFVGFLASDAFMASAFLHAFRANDVLYSILCRYGEIIFLGAGIALILYFEYLLHKL